MDINSFFGRDNLVGTHAPELPSDTGPWINSKPLDLKQLRQDGKVVLLDIWTYSCVNCVRTLPYLKKWWNDYHDKGLVIIGVHSPEFAFEKDLGNVKDAVQAQEIEYPVVLDSDYKIWNAFANHYWPRKYLIDTNGIIVYDHSGEGDYIETEHAIRKELQRANPKLTFGPVSTHEHHHSEGAVCFPFSHELYCGYNRGTLGNRSDIGNNRELEYVDLSSESYEDEQFYLDGKWEVGGEFARHAESEIGSIAIIYHGTEVNFVAKNSDINQGKVYIEVDGKPLREEAAGEDVILDDDGLSYINVAEPKMYQAIKDPDYGEHVFRIKTTSPSFSIYAYTFGGCTE